MGNINLSQSIQEKQALARGKFFDKGFFINLAILLIILAGYGGTVWYLGKLDDELLSLQTNSAEKTASLKGPKVNRVVDIRDRIDAITNNQSLNSDPRLALSDVEHATMGAIQLREYSRNEEQQTIVIRGLSESLRYIAQQMLAFKKLKGVQSVHAEDVKYDMETGKIEFELTLVLQEDAPDSMDNNS